MRALYEAFLLHDVNPESSLGSIPAWKSSDSFCFSPSVLSKSRMLNGHEKKKHFIIGCKIFHVAQPVSVLQIFVYGQFCDSV